MKWFISVFLEEFLIDFKGNLLQKYLYKRKKKAMLEDIINDVRKKYEKEVYFNDLDGFMEINAVFQRLARKCIVSWKVNLSYLEILGEIVDRFIEEYSKYGPYKANILRGLQDIFEKCFENVNSEIEDEDLKKAVNIISLNNERGKKEISDGINKLIDKVTGNYTFSREILVDQKKKITEFLLVDKCINGSSRDNEVTYIIKQLDSYSWIHVWGEVWCGKTQFLKLISDRLYAYKYIDLDEINLKYGIDTIYFKMAESCGSKSDSIEGIVNDFLGYWLLDGVLFIDGIHEAILDEKLIEMISLLSVQCKARNVKLITCGYSDISHVIRHQCDISNLLVYKLPDMSMQEIIEVMLNNGIPKDALNLKIAQFLADTLGKYPALVMELIFELKDKDWKADEAYFEALFLAKADGLDEQLERIILSRIEDENIRKLLYRMAEVGHNVPIKVLSEIGDIAPRIEELDRARYVISSRWGMEMDGAITLPRIFRNVADKYLSEKEKEEIHLILINYFREKRILNELDICYLISHLSDLQLYNEVGELYIKVLSSMMEQNVRDDVWRFAFFWDSFELPKKMDVTIQAVVRMQQVRYLTFANKDYTYQLNDLLRMTEENEECGQYLLMLMPLLSQSDFTAHEKCMNTCLDLGLWGEKNVELKKLMDSSNVIEWLYPEMSTLDYFIMKYSLIVSDVNELEIFSTQLMEIPYLQIEEFAKHQRKILFGVLEKIRLKLVESDKDKYEKILSKLGVWTQTNKFLQFQAVVDISFLRFLFDTKKDYNKAIDFYERKKNLYMSGIEHHEFVDTMAKLLYECAETDTNVELITSSYFSLPENSEFIYEEVYTCLLYMDIASIQESTYAAEKMLNYVEHSNEVHNEFSTEARAKAEYFINAYLCNQLQEKIVDCSDFIVELLGDRSIIERKAILVLLLSDMTYILGDIVNNNPPTILPNGEKYAIPERKRYWMLENKERIEELYSEEKTSALIFVLAQLLEFYGYESNADILCKKIFYVDNNEISLIADFFRLNSYLILKLIKLDQWELLSQFIVLHENQISHLYNQAEPIRILLIISAYLANLSQNGEFYMINLEQITTSLGFLNVKEEWKIYFEEYCKIIKVFVYEEGDADILLECLEKINNTKLDSLRAVIYLLMYARVSSDDKKLIEKILIDFFSRLYMNNDYFFKKVLEKINFAY